MRFAKVFSALIASSVLLTCSFTVNASEEQTYDIFTYINVDDNNDGTDDSVSITGCDDAETVNIPDEINGLPVTKIASSAFNMHELKTLNIGNNVIEICPSAFFSCQSLTKVNISDSVTNISDSAFFRCYAIEEVNFGKNVEVIDYNAFSCCYLLKEINLPDSVKVLGENCFNSCNSITTVTIPENVNSIGYDAFMHCEKLISINVSDSNDNYSSVDGVLFDKNKKTIYSYPLAKTDSEYIIPDSVTEIGKWSFNNADNLEKITFGKNVKTIGREAFSSCKNLSEIKIYNFNCDIHDDMFTFYNGMDGNGYYFNGTIYGYDNSSAQEYAEKYERNFVSLGQYSFDSEDLSDSYLLGDANLDSRVNVRDAAWIASRLAQGLVSDLPDCADYNSDQRINVRDAAAIAKSLS